MSDNFNPQSDTKPQKPKRIIQKQSKTDRFGSRSAPETGNDNEDYLSSYNYYIYYHGLSQKDPSIPKPTYKPNDSNIGYIKEDKEKEDEEDQPEQIAEGGLNLNQLDSLTNEMENLHLKGNADSPEDSHPLIGESLFNENFMNFPKNQSNKQSLGVSGNIHEPSSGGQEASASAFDYYAQTSTSLSHQPENLPLWGGGENSPQQFAMGGGMFPPHLATGPLGMNQLNLLNMNMGGFGGMNPYGVLNPSLMAGGQRLGGMPGNMNLGNNRQMPLRGKQGGNKKGNRNNNMEQPNQQLGFDQLQMGAPANSMFNPFYPGHGNNPAAYMMGQSPMMNYAYINDFRNPFNMNMNMMQMNMGMGRNNFGMGIPMDMTGMDYTQHNIGNNNNHNNNYGNNNNKNHPKKKKGNNNNDNNYQKKEISEPQSFEEIIEKAVELSKDHSGSRLVQKKYEEGTEEIREQIFAKFKPEILTLSKDIFGNYAIQKVLEFKNQERNNFIMESLKGKIYDLSLHMYGCRVIQQLISVIDESYIPQITFELKDHFAKCIEDQNGNHVIQKLIDRLKPGENNGIYDVVINNIVESSKHQYGCRVIQTLFKQCNEEQVIRMLDEIYKEIKELSEDQFGNYIIQYILEHRKGNYVEPIYEGLKGHIYDFSIHKYASNVVERALTFGNHEQQEAIINEIIQQDDQMQECLFSMVKDKFGNYVVQKIIEYSSPETRKNIISRIISSQSLKKRDGFSKHVINFIEKFNSTSGNMGINLNQGGNSGGKDNNQKLERGRGNEKDQE
ncbi:MAG: hypothetical protein MJ252_23790 [archaeon]|nr:hypothetical protein [archaeon]